MQDKILGSLILEAAPRDSAREETIITNLGSKDRVVAEATFQDLDIRNRNGRYYAKTDVKPEIDGPRLKELMWAKQLFSECSHPLSDDIVRQQTIDPKFKCCEISKLWVEGDRVRGHYQGTYNDYGYTIDQELRHGGKPAFSLRALGSIKEINGKPYVKGLKIITYDYVVYPSHKAAYTEKILNESTIRNVRGSKYINESAVPLIIEESGKKDFTKRDYETYLEEVNNYGKIVTFTDGDAQQVLNRLQRESASVGMMLETFEGFANEVKLVNNKIRLSTHYGETIYLSLNEHVDNLITNYIYGY